MNRILFDAEELDDDRVVLPAGDRRARHIVAVLRPAIGDTLRVGVIRGGRGVATVVELDEEHVTLELSLEPPADPPRLSLALALPRPKALTRALAAAASFGLREIVLLNAWRVDKSYWSSPRLSAEALDKALRDGCEQGQQTWLPELRRERLLMPYLEDLTDGLADAEPAQRTRLLAQPGAEPIEQAARGEAARSALVAIGPEGGWIADEVSAFAGAGFRPVSLGAPTLRSHDAVVAALAQLSLLARL